MEIIIFMVVFVLGFTYGMYVSSQAETHIENRINPKMKMSKKDLGLKELKK